MPATPIDPKTLEHPAIFVNHIQATRLGDSLVRLTVGEGNTPTDTVYRAALLMHIGDVRSLITLLQQLVDLPVAADAPQSRPN